MQTEVGGKEWEWLTFPSIAPGILEARQQEVISERQRLLTYYEAQLTRSMQATIGELLPRPGLDIDTMRRLPCVFGECVEPVSSQCQECLGMCCSLHSLHDRHKFWSEQAVHMNKYFTTPRHDNAAVVATLTAVSRGGGRGGGRSRGV